MIIDEEVYLVHEIENFLDHHGVKGMHWGIRNDDKLKGRRAGEVDPDLITNLIIIAGKETYRYIDSGKAHRRIEKGRAFFTKIPATNWKTKPALGRKNLSPDEIMKVAKGVNPNYPKLGSLTNCRRCTFAYELRRRGYDVTATHTISGSGQDKVSLRNAITPGKRTVRSTTTAYLLHPKVAKEIHQHPWGSNNVEPNGKAIFEALKKQPNGARGELGMQFITRSGHSVAWENIRGKPYIIDTQSHKIYSSPAGFDRVFNKQIRVYFKKRPAITKAGFTRLDNVPLHDDYLLRWVKNA